MPPPASKVLTLLQNTDTHSKFSRNIEHVHYRMHLSMQKSETHSFRWQERGLNKLQDDRKKKHSVTINWNAVDLSTLLLIVVDPL